MRKMRILIAVLMLSVTVSAQYVPLKVSLTILERLVIGGMIPKETNFANWKIFNDLRNELAPTEDELKALDPKPNATGGTNANWEAIPEKEITFSETTERMITDALKELDSRSKLLPEHISVYKKFVLKEKE